MDDFMVNWPLNEQSVVVDIGAFEGIWAEELGSRYNPKVMHLFEPQYGPHLNRLLDRLNNKYNFALYSHALGITDGAFEMGEYGTDGCSFLRTREDAARPDNSRKEFGQGVMREIQSAFAEYDIDEVDILGMNIEGYEYVLLPYMITNNMMTKLNFVVVQFHEFPDPDSIIYQEIQQGMSNTHEVYFDHFPAWVAWKRR